MLSVPPSSQDPRTFAIIGAAYEVHRVLGAGFLELFYKDALAIEFALRDIPFRKEVPCGIEYKGRPLRDEYHMDFVCFDQIVLEIKARSVTGPADCGLLLNFGASKLEHKRFIWEPPT